MDYGIFNRVQEEMRQNEERMEGIAVVEQARSFHQEVEGTENLLEILETSGTN